MAASAFCFNPLNAAPEEKPNMVLILIDDMGWKDVSYAGSTYYKTPNIDRLAKEGVVFTNGYSSSPVSSPSRGAILTGKNPAATQFTCVFGPETEVPGGDSLFLTSRKQGSSTNQFNEARNRHAVPRTSKMLVEKLRDNGYKTALFGKWHCGVGEEFLPSARGFETAIGYRIKHIATKGHYIKSFKGNLAGLDAYKPTEYISEVLTDECIKFMSANAEKPFVAVLSHYLVHTPLQGLPKKVAYYKKQPKDDQNNPEYAAMVESVDESVGKICDALKKLNIDKKTIVVFTSDNGGYTPQATSNYPLMGGKSFPFEAGMKVPFILKYPGAKPNTSSEPIIGMDIFPTFLDAAGIKLTKEDAVDGVSLLPVVKGASLPSRPLVFHFPHYTHATGPFSSILYKGWKLIRFYNDEDGAYLLYNLGNDPEEQKDLSEVNPEKVKELQEILSAELKRMHAEMPIKNPKYKPHAKGNNTRKTSLKLAEKERAIFQNRRGE